MSRAILDESNIHPAIRQTVASLHSEVVQEVQQAIAANDIVVVGMQYNPHCAKARKALQGAGRDFKYLEYGGYTSEWRKRGALKMWAGWETFPMVFHKGTLVGGAADLKALLESGEL